MLYKLCNKRILIIAPHNDDEVIGTWFLMRKLAGRATIGVVVATAHEGDPELTQRRRDETREALSRVDVSDCSYWDIPDGSAHLHETEIKDNLRIADLEWDYILCPAPNDRTMDHIAIARQARRMIPDYKLIWYRSTWWTFTSRQADFLVEGSFSDKRAALKLFRSQSHIALLRSLFLSCVETFLRSGFPKPAESFLLANSNGLAKSPLNSLSLRHFLRLLFWQ